MHEHGGEIQESLSIREKKFLAYITQLSGTGHRGTESMRERTLRDFEASRGNLCDDIMHTNSAYDLYDNMRDIK